MKKIEKSLNQEMASPSSPLSTFEQQQQQRSTTAETAVTTVAVKKKQEECVHKTKTIKFLGRTTPVVLQNDNGPCPLLAICNVLLLRNNLSLNTDSTEVSQERLLSLVAERLIDSNSNNKDAEYVQNQQQNIADAIDSLPRLTTGIDVNIKFRRIDDFEFTRECAIFDLLDIPLYHGWMVDAQDNETAKAIGSKSYNALMGELVALETRRMEVESKNCQEEGSVDFVAANTDAQNVGKGDLEEEAELLRALKLSHVEVFSQVELQTSVADSLETDGNGGVVTLSSGATNSFHDNRTPLDNENGNLLSSSNVRGEVVYSSSKTESKCLDHSACTESGEHVSTTDVINKTGAEILVQAEGALINSGGKITSHVNDDSTNALSADENILNQSLPIDVHEPANTSIGQDKSELSALASGLSSLNIETDSSSGRMQNVYAPETFSASVDGDEPIQDSGNAGFEDREPVYEREVIPFEEVDKMIKSKDEITPQQGELIKSFLKNSANQLTFHGLFCLQDELKERELCVFFRNNHFSTMFKYEGELYLLVTDQGYINQPDLVWEKLNEVNGDTLFVTGNFKEFKVESDSYDRWDEHNVMTSTAQGYLASIDSGVQAGLDTNSSDLQLAIALQQQEFEQQPSPQYSNSQQPSISTSRLITGPQVPRSSIREPSSRPEPKSSKDKCVIM